MRTKWKWYSAHSPVKDARLFQHIAQVDVSVEKVWVQCDRLLEMMDGQPNLVLGIEHTAQVAPGHRKVRPSFDRLQIARLQRLPETETWGMEKWSGINEMCRVHALHHIRTTGSRMIESWESVFDFWSCVGLFHDTDGALFNVS